MPVVVTPDVESDVIKLLAGRANLAAIIKVQPTANANAYAGEPKPSKASGIPNDSWWAYFSGDITDHDNDGNRTEFLIDVFHRGKRNDEANTRINARKVRDEIINNERGTFGHWVGSSGASYVDLVFDGMSHLPIAQDDADGWILHLRVLFDG